MKLVYTQAKGGQGTTTVAACAAIMLSSQGRTLFVGKDDAFAVMGAPEPGDRGAVHVTDALEVCHHSDTRSYVGRDIREMYDHVVYDGHENCWSPDHTTLVTRACYLALRAAAVLTSRPNPWDSVILIQEPGRALQEVDVERALNKPVTVVPWDPAVARAVDAGLLTSRVPKALRLLVP